MLSILCVTRAEPYAGPLLAAMARVALACDAEFVVAVDGRDAAYRLEAMDAMDLPARVVQVQSQGYIESVLDAAVAGCRGDFILRLDDDEACSPPMARWLVDGAYVEADHWKFPRMHLWRDGQAIGYLGNAPLWPDHQTRLSVRGKSGGRRHVHAGSPFGGGRLAPVAMEHHKFLVKTADERRAIAARYDSIGRGLGTGGFLPFNLPEEAFAAFEVRALEYGHHAADLDAREAA